MGLGTHNSGLHVARKHTNITPVPGHFDHHLPGSEWRDLVAYAIVSWVVGWTSLLSRKIHYKEDPPLSNMPSLTLLGVRLFFFD